MKLCRLVLAAAFAGLAAAPALSAEDVVGFVDRHIVGPEETMLSIARDRGLGYVELMAANLEVDPWLPGEGREIVIPAMHVLPDAPRRGVVINLTEMRLYLFTAKGQLTGTWPIGIGREGMMTPKGTTKVVRKQLAPTWTPTPSMRERNPDLPVSVPPGEDNPLGDRALYLGWPAYLIHGTNKPFGVGRRVSSGCIRLYPEDIVELYELTPVGTSVTVVDQPVKLGWRDGTLYLQVHPSKAQADQIEAEQRYAPEPLPEMYDLIAAAAKDRMDMIDWQAVNRAAAERSGIPVAILGEYAVDRPVSGGYSDGEWPVRSGPASAGPGYPGPLPDVSPRGPAPDAAEPAVPALPPIH